MVRDPRGNGRGGSAIRSGRGDGFTLMEILVGLTVLGLAVFTFSAYAAGQRKSLNHSNRLADGTRIAASELETLKGRLADSAYFKTVYDRAGARPDVRTIERKVNGMKYAVTLTLGRAPAPLYGLKARARADWDGGHSIELGLLCPGVSGWL